MNLKKLADEISADFRAKPREHIVGNVVKILCGPYRGQNGIIRRISNKTGYFLLEVDPFGKTIWCAKNEVE